ncbi:hypothetical protein AWB71_06001 [Caballeronia peredens]|nr:hypothetical protein AWB71_06001 [Caballeronia peredens]
MKVKEQADLQTKYKPSLRAFLMDDDFQYVLNAHGQKDDFGHVLAVQDPSVGVQYVDINENVEGLVNVVDELGHHYVFDMPGRSNVLLNAVKKDLNRTFRMWGRICKNIFIINPLLNPEKSVEAAEKQAMEYLNLKPSEDYNVHFVFPMFSEHAHYKTVKAEFESSAILQSLKKVGTVHVIEIAPEFNTELPSIIQNDEKAWKFLDLQSKGRLKAFTADIVDQFIEEVFAAFDKLFGHLIEIGMDEKGLLAIFMSAEGGVRKSTLDGLFIEWMRLRLSRLGN